MIAHHKYLLYSFLLSCSMSAVAATTNTIDTANSNSANASSTNNAQSINFNTQPANHTTNTMETTVQPMMGGFSSSFSSDYCGATMQASAGAVGFGFSAGAPKIDGSCLMLRTFERTQQAASAIAPSDPFMAATLREASLEILGLIDPKVHEIFQRKGLIKSKPVESKPVESKPVESKPVESKRVESKPVESKPVESKPAESKPAESKPAESKPAESKPVESKPVESKPVESKPVESQPVESQPVESQPDAVNSDPVKNETIKVDQSNQLRINESIESSNTDPSAGIRNSAGAK
ncbi:MAG: hypothetical protein WCH41_05880 [Methylophilaceae bacterium]